MGSQRRRVEPMAVAAAVVGFMPMVGVPYPARSVALRRDRSDPKKLGRASAWFGIAYGAMWVLFIAVQRG